MKNLQWTDQNPGIGNTVSQAKAGPLNYTVARNLFVSVNARTNEPVVVLDYIGTVDSNKPTDTPISKPVSDWVKTIGEAKDACQAHYNQIQEA